MKIVPIFADTKREPPKGLFSVCIDPEKDERDELEIISDHLSDVEFLRKYFKKREAELKRHPIYNQISVREAVTKTRKEYRQLLQRIMELSESESENLDEKFEPLSLYERPELVKSKAKGTNKRSWIRLYAIKVAPNLFIVTGGGIKLVRTMKEDDYLQKQLQKMNRVKDYLKSRGMFDSESFQELEF